MLAAVRFLPPPLPPPPPLHLRRRRHHQSHRFPLRSYAFPQIELISSAAALTTAAAIFLRLRSNTSSVAGEWVIYTCPTPFNRSVLLRCPSININDRFTLRGRIPTISSSSSSGGEDICYQRRCIRTEDGGVISIDWPEILDLEKENRLDTTVVFVPGTAEGSGEKNVKAFVKEATANGWFPVVVNPRGCAGSPVTSPRLFTAADSDDISTAIQFINKLRPWTTMMAVGWGYGANMLTKYLAEVGEGTPLTAAVCIDNPFDLNEATRSLSHNVAMEQKMTSGLMDILRANKVLFQGKNKGFDVQKALSAVTVCDFDRAISVISYGFNSVEEFYSSASTRESVGLLKIPVLFIQCHNGTVPPLSIPCSSIAENPCTSLLLCSHIPSSIARNEGSAVLWCQHVSIEWLAAVELALLKGRHPLLKDVDITINPSKGRAFVDGKSIEEVIQGENRASRTNDSAGLLLSHRNVNGDKYPKLSQPKHVNGYLTDRMTNLSKTHNLMAQNTGSSGSRVGGQFHRGKKDCEEAEEKSNNETQKNQVGNTGSAKEGGTTDDEQTSDSEQSQVLQTAAVVVNMLDVTMPGTLDDERKKKVLDAVGQGETLMKALEGAVPEDVRGKLTTAVSEILQKQSTNLSLEGLKRIGWVPNVKIDVKSSLDKLRGVTNSGSSQKENDASEQTSQKASESYESRKTDLTNSDSGKDKAQEGAGNQDAQATKSLGEGLEVGDKQSRSTKVEKASNGTDMMSEQSSLNQSIGLAETSSTDEKDHAAENESSNMETKRSDTAGEDHTQVSSGSHSSEEMTTPGSSSSDGGEIGKDDNDTQKSVGKGSNENVDQKAQVSSTTSDNSSAQHSGSNASSINVTQALDALTGVDDSTQMAVNSVFGVLENMIDQLEKATNQDNSDQKNKDGNQAADSETLNSRTAGGDKTENAGEDASDGRLETDTARPSDKKEHNIQVKDATPQESYDIDKEGNSCYDYHPSVGKTNTTNTHQEEDTRKFSDLSHGSISKSGYMPIFPVGPAVNAYWEPPYRNYQRRYFLQESPTNSVNSGSADLLLDLEEGRWRIVDQAGKTTDVIKETGESQIMDGKDGPSLVEDDEETILEPSYIILDTDYSQPSCVITEEDQIYNNPSNVNDAEMEVIFLINSTVLDALKVEVSRKLGISKLEDMERNLVLEMQNVASTVSQAVLNNAELRLGNFRKQSMPDLEKYGIVDGECVVKAVSSAIQETSYLRKVLPVGVIVGSSLAALRKYFEVATLQGDHQNGASLHHSQDKVNYQDCNVQYKHDFGKKERDNKTMSGADMFYRADSCKDEIMVGAVTAALGASALFVRNKNKDEESERSVEASHSGKKESDYNEHSKTEDEMQEKNQSNVVSSLAEKAMSVASPVVPTKSDGEVDHERLVAVLAELGQKGGFLRLIGKVALFWGGIRGALSLTDRLISFLHIADRPFFQRLLGFFCMALVLWSPVVIPLLPALVRSWTTKTSNIIAEYSCILGFYCAIMILIILWGKRIRGYENPLEQYGLTLKSVPKVRHFVRGLLGGLMSVLFVHSINALLGYAYLYWPLDLLSVDKRVLLQECASFLLLALRGTAMAVGVALVEELLFRSWLSEEVAVDFGYYRAILISGLAFSIFQRSLSSMPSFFMLSLAMVGIKQRSRGKLYASIGFRAGILTANFILQHRNIVSYHPSAPSWLTSIHPWRPFDGIVGLTVCIALAALFFQKTLLGRRTKLRLERFGSTRASQFEHRSNSKKALSIYKQGSFYSTGCGGAKRIIYYFGHR